MEGPSVHVASMRKGQPASPAQGLSVGTSAVGLDGTQGSGVTQSTGVTQGTGVAQG